LADRKKIWFSFLPLDYLGVENYLNHYAVRGWALAEISDCRTLTVALERSNRIDLCYSVTCASTAGNEEQIREQVNQMGELGWRPVATVNHFDIYESMPCRHTAAPQTKTPRTLFLRSIATLLLFGGLLLCLLLLAYFRGVSLVNDWYTSNTGVVLHFLGPFLGIMGGYYLLWIGSRLFYCSNPRPPRKIPMILRGTFPVLSAVWILILTTALISDLVPNQLCCLVLILALFGGTAFFYSHFRFDLSGKLRSSVSMTLAVVIALSLLLNQVFPGESRAQIGACTWRDTLSAVVHGEDIGLEAAFIEAVSYKKTGSWFVTRTEYGEEWDSAHLSSTVYQCRGTMFCSFVQEDLLRAKEWQPASSSYHGSWSAVQGETYFLLLRKGNTLVYLSSDQNLLPHLEDFSLDLER
jgi:hypothetical protein